MAAPDRRREGMNGDDEEIVAASVDPSLPLEWRFSQVFGERSAGEEVQEVDVISAIEFDHSGDHLATGDRGGRVVLFERSHVRNSSGGARRDLEDTDHPLRHPEFRYKTEFQSHDPEFDYLKSLEIEEKINKIRWCQTANGALFLLSTNDKTIKYWKVQDKKIKKVCEVNSDPSKTGAVASSGNPTACLGNGGVPEAISSLRFPLVTSHESSPVARCRRVYSHAHDYHINSISNNSDGETFISADDLRINLWNLEISNQSFNIVDVKPEKMEDLSGKALVYFSFCPISNRDMLIPHLVLAEVITSAEFHPTHCNMLAYSSSKGSIRLIDLRQSALCDSHSKLFEEPEAAGPKSFFTEIIASVSDIKFAKEGRYLLSRDYMTLKVRTLSLALDMTMPVKLSVAVMGHQHGFSIIMYTHIPSVHIALSSNMFRVFSVSPGSTESATLEASRNPMRLVSPLLTY
ncbi:hypothetical protein HID58_095887 [Brassica napus]|uniref:Serine/threonine-protein phosphatase 2A 55 kDa regulatory subunit B n=1 Tax=Brassica napus TaxID=3708 RepID=A0ABQ7X208_BRANA|nr:hypothetical protein HID58_095887 [Brassica napus]